MSLNSDTPSTFSHITLTKPTPECDLVVPEWMQGDELLSERYRELAEIHIAVCDFCQRRMAAVGSTN